MKPYSLASSAVNHRSRSESALDLLDRLAGVERDPLGEGPLGVDASARPWISMSAACAADAAVRLVHDDP